MQIKYAEFRNFKLLEDVRLEFSMERSRPLTVIRAENGSGKTSILWALLWGFYGARGLPAGAQDIRLTSSAAPVDVPVDIQVIVEFERDDGHGTTAYRMIRTVQEIPRGSDEFDRGPVKVRLLRRTQAGLEDVDGDPETIVAQFLPPRLKSIFFTDGDDVQRFISGETIHGRQNRVHEAIKALLGLDSLGIARDDVESVVGKLRKETARSAGADLEAAEKHLSEITEQVASKTKELDDLTERRSRIVSDKAVIQKELNEVRGIGNIDEINAEISHQESELARLERTEDIIVANMKIAVISQDASWALAHKPLHSGYAILTDLADKRIIPGPSIEVLTDRLDLGTCICGADISAGQPARSHVEALRAEQRQVSESRSRQTQTFHAARMGRAEYESHVEDRTGFAHSRAALLAQYAQNRDAIKAVGLRIAVLKDKRAAIDEERVRTLTSRLENAERKLTDVSQEIGRLEGSLADLEDRAKLARESYDNAEKASKVNKTLRTKRLVADDLTILIGNTLSVLESQYVERVSTRMNEMFMEVVGSDPELAGAVFRKVWLSDTFDIMVSTVGDGHLDPDFEVNGASKRALTLSFIWALMEVAGQTAPRIIDTPLGMTAGGVKQRMVEAITRPPSESDPPFQVILLLTRSELRDIESLLEQRAGAMQTLSSNKDYPADLVHDWKLEYPVIRACACNIRQFCDLCQRRYDDEHALVARGG
jgi:DNA sulfur modification protein DndD